MLNEVFIIKEGPIPDSRITIEYVGDESNGLVDLLDYIKKQAGIGHSFSVVVDPGDSEYERKFGFDGDGSFRIARIERVGRK